MYSKKLIVIAAPSGAGKTSIIKKLMTDPSLNLGFSVSSTTRNKRKDEIHGKDYYFLSLSEFKNKIKNKEFVEWEEVYNNVFYGTLESEINDLAKKGRNIIFDIDVVGGLNIKNKFSSNTLSIFIKPPSIDSLKLRLEERNTDSKKTIKIRVEKASKELESSNLYDHVILNQDFKIAINKIKSLILKFIHKK